MKLFRKVTVLVLALVAMSMLQGCLLLVAGGAAAGAAYGTVKYSKNTLAVTLETPLDKAWSAAQAALKDLQLPVYTSKKDGLSGRLEARNIEDQLVVIELSRKAETLTELQITVGTFDSSKNRDREQLIYDKLKSYL
jgi:hypothetical protein